MRRTEQEFKAEILRRSSAYRQRREKHLKNTLLSFGCIAILIFGFQFLPSGFGGSSAETADAAFGITGANQQAPESMEEMKAPQEPVESGNVSGQTPADSWLYSSETSTECIVVCTQPDLEECERIFTDPDQIAAIESAISVFRDHGELPEDNPGNAEGMAYVITVINSSGEWRYTLFNNALYSSGDDRWYSSSECYEVLKKLILQEPLE